MEKLNAKETLEQVLGRVCRRIFARTAASAAIHAGLIFLPLAALAIAVSQRWFGGAANFALAAGALVLVAGFSLFRGWRSLRDEVHLALALDQGGGLKDRVASACEFLAEPALDEARTVQVNDAVRRAETLDVNSVFRFELPRFAAAMPLALALFALAFFVPPSAQSVRANAAKDEVKAAQLRQLEELKQELAAKENLPKELQDVLKKLEDVKKQFERGEIGERDVMLQLAQLDENLRSKVAELGVENLENEMNAIMPHLSASAATLEAAQAMKEQKLDKAAEELKNLADKVEQKKLSKEDQKKLAAHLGNAVAKLGKKKSSDSFSGDLAQASDSLEKSDCEGFKSACQNMGNKLSLLSKCRGLKSACNKIGLCKSCLGQCSSKELGYTLGPKSLNKSKGGLKAGSSTAGDPLGEKDRLADSYKKILQVSGQAGNGPVESETEVTDGQMSQSQVGAKELHANFAAVAEEVIEKEDVPLSHRFHVKRYFQAIRPQE